MMFKRTILLIILIVFLTQILSFASGENVLVLYDSENYYGDERDAVVSISNLLKHFEKDIEYQTIDNFSASLDQYDYVMVLCFRDQELSKALINSLSEYDKPILWIWTLYQQLRYKSS